MRTRSIRVRPVEYLGVRPNDAFVRHVSECLTRSCIEKWMRAAGRNVVDVGLEVFGQTNGVGVCTRTNIVAHGREEAMRAVTSGSVAVNWSTVSVDGTSGGGLFSGIFSVGGGAGAGMRFMASCRPSVRWRVVFCSALV